MAVGHFSPTMYIAFLLFSGARQIVDRLKCHINFLFLFKCEIVKWLLARITSLFFFFFKIVLMTQRESALEQAGIGVEGDG